MRKPPCTKDCPKRSITCHAECEDYLEYKNERLAFNEMLRKKKHEEDVYMSIRRKKK